MAPTETLEIALIGAGRVGTAVAELLRRKENVIVGVASSSPDSAGRAADLLGAPVFDLDDGLPAANLVLLGVPDRAIAEVAGRLAGHIGADSICVHFAGSFGTEPLQAVAVEARGVAALHPVQACPDMITALARLPGSAWGVTCSPEVRDWAHDLVADQLDGIPVDVAEDQRPLWHAAAVTVSNGLAALLWAGEAMLSSLGVPEPAAVLGPLARGTLTNAVEGGGGGATLTGPIARGEAEAIARHVAGLAQDPEGLLEAYQHVARLILLAADRTGHLDSSSHAAVAAAIEP